MHSSLFPYPSTPPVTASARSQILEPEPVAEDFMTSPVMSCQPDATISQVIDRGGECSERRAI